MNTPATSTPHFDELSRPWRACIEEAWAAFRHGSLPIGAVAIDADGNVLARGRNRLAERHASSPHLPGTPYLTGSQLAHAEVNALLELGPNHDPPQVLLYTTTEPCPLCMGAARMSSIARVVYASRDPWAGCASMADGVPYLARRGPTVEGPVDGLERALVAWQASVHVEASGEEPHFMSSWREILPEACDTGIGLFESGSLRELAETGSTAEAGWELLREAVG